jgi:uncharacterized membrane protein (DUF2068 family)
LIASWLWFRSAIELLKALGLLVAGGVAGKLVSLATSGTAIPSFLLRLGAFLGVAFAILAVLAAAAGLGVWMMKSWGRTLAITLAALGLLLSFRAFFHPHPLNLIRPIVDVATICYLMVPDVQSKFS